ncbi:MAG: hypothetical protein J1F02_12130 [Lachnospiraceae bacterium]|nr:hypothetical protein [Lachnospiraceae bacterium]
MKDQKEFLRQMGELIDFGRAKENVLTKEEIDDFCSDMTLSREQMELVYAYLSEHRIEIPGFSSKTGSSEPEEKMSPADSKYLRVYRRELRELPEYTKEDIEELYQRLRAGEEEVLPKVIEAHLKRVTTLAGRYRGRGVPLEDLIQEGNLELVTCLNGLLGNKEVADYKKAIDHAVRSHLIEIVDNELASGDSESSLLARINLLLEATHTLAEEYGRIATIEELAEFTHMDAGEIRMYVELSRDNIELGSGEKTNE